MAFVNEFISSADVEKYDLEAIDERFVVGGTHSRQWTIDREHDVYMRNVARGAGSDPDLRNQTEWTLYWHGDLLILRLDLLDGGGKPGEPGWSHWRLVWLDGSDGLPLHLKGQKDRIIDTLKEALTVYRGAGVYSAKYTDYRVVLDIAEGCVL